MADSHIANQFRGLPIGELISAPLTAACEAQIQLAKSTADFINQVGLDANSNNVKMVDFSFKRPMASGDANAEGVSYGEEQVSLKVPFLSLVNTPALSIKKVNITFDMEVKETTSETSSSNTSGSFSATSNIGFWFAKTKVEVKGSVSSHKENTRKTDNSAKYHISIEAEDTGMPEGLSRVYDILQTAISPTKITTKPDSNPSKELSSPSTTQAETVAE